MREIRLYVEGGGDQSASKDALRGGFSRFLQSLHALARTKKSRLRIVLCGPRQQAMHDFNVARRSNPEAINILLVDSEEAVSGASPREHLRNRDEDGVALDIRDDECHLMVQVVESWLVADPDALARYYRKGFVRSALPKAMDVETVPKSRVQSSLVRASEKTLKKRYQKVTHCADLLALIDPVKVRKRARHCDRLFKAIEEKIHTL